jgi:DNA modification methylase
MTDFATDNVMLLAGNSLDRLKEIPDNAIHAIVTDPPYGISMCGKKWDYDVPSIEIFKECLRVLVPGGHILAFSCTRTQHRMAVRIEDAGFEIRNIIAWIYGSGMPKALDVAKAIDKREGIWRGRAGAVVSQSASLSGPTYEATPKGEPVTEKAKEWDGWHSCLKPAMDPITVARKPMRSTLVENVLEHGTGAMNVDACRVQTGEQFKPMAMKETIDGDKMTYGERPWHKDPEKVAERIERVNESIEKTNRLGRWPANIIRTDEEEVHDVLKGAARFFYCAKIGAKDRANGNTHPTVKPVELMRYLVRLVTPPDGTVLDPFMGSGSTGVAALAEKMRFVGVEMTPEYFSIAEKRIKEEMGWTPPESTS